MRAFGIGCLALSLAVTPLLAAMSAMASEPEASQVFAGVPDRRIVGFSEDGRYFAFEIFGIDEYSSSPFAEMLVLDTSSNTIVAGFPMREVAWAANARADEIEALLRVPPDQMLASVRAMLGTAAGPELAALGVRATDNRVGRSLVANPATEIATEVEFVLEANFPLDRTGFRLRVENVELPADAPGLETCTALRGPFMAPALTLRDAEGTVVSAWQEDAVPEDRACRDHYVIHDVVLHEANGVAVVILRTFWPGFEGPSVRYTAIALPVRFGM